jgi:predicted acylesterase/phospholipase RssA
MLPALRRPLRWLVLILGVCTREVLGQSPRHRDSEHVPVILTLSGGVSLGSYEAGVNWGLVEVFKQSASDSLRKAWNLPWYQLRTAAGASAGNINAFLAAIQWCSTTEPVPPEASLLWKVWVRTGFDQLFPLERYNQRDTTSALFSRRYFHRVLFDTIAAALQHLPPSGPPGGCAIPIGVTITRVAPDTIPISSGIRALTQRYAAAVALARRGDSLVFLAPTAALRDSGKLGAMVLLPDCGNVVKVGHVFPLIEASSAFPGAFAPVSLQYQDQPHGDCDGQPHDSALFSDGGLFDNNPIDLAVGLYNGSVWRHPDRADSTAIMIFIDPDAARGRLAEVARARADSNPPPATGGIAALLDLFAGAVPSARQYEAQSFARLLARAPHVFARNNIKITNRRFVLVGEQLGNFAAFLGKPFREYDFYVGVYDALAFFAAEGCPTSREVDSLCVARRLRTLVETRDLDFGGTDSLPRTLLRMFYAAEYPGAAPPPGLAPASSARGALLLGLVQANRPLADSAFDNQRCKGGDVIVVLLCHNGLREMLQRFASDTVLEALARIGDPSAPCLAEDWLSSPVHCDGDQSFVAFVQRPDRFLADKVGLMLHQLWHVERDRKQEGEKDWTGFATLSEVVFQSGTAYRYRRGFEPNTSSVPHGSGRSWFATFVPNYVSINLGSQGLEFGYRPTWHLSNKLALTASVAPLHLIQDAASDVDRYYWVAGPVLHWKETSPAFSGIETGVELFGRWKRDAFGPYSGHVVSFPISFYFLADKMRVGLRVLPGNATAVNDRGQIMMTVGLSDLNGLVYWMFRK